MDIKVTYLQDVIPVSQVTNIQNVVPRTLDVRGPDLRNASRVEVNEVVAPSFMILNKHRMLVQVPSSQEKEIIKSIAVLSNYFTRTSSSKVNFEFTLNPKKTEGLEKLIQSFILYLFRTPGTDAWYPNSGGGIQKIVGANFSRSNASGVTAAFTTSVHRTRSQLIALQSINNKLKASEKLAAANVLSAVYSAELTALLARVEIISQSGERAAVGMEL